jgi:hypothetical protein
MASDHRGAPYGNRYAVGNRGGSGQKPKYKPEFAAEAVNLALLGLTDEQIGAHFGVVQSVVTQWKRQHREFGDAIKQAREVADGRVAASLYQRACGYSYRKVRGYKKVTIQNDKGEWIEVEEPIEETIHIPPDPTCMIFWLANRRRQLWKRGDTGFEPQDHIEGRNKLKELWAALQPEPEEPLPAPAERKPS